MSRNDLGKRYGLGSALQPDVELLSRLVAFAATPLEQLSHAARATLRDLLTRGPWVMLKIDLRRGLELPKSELEAFHSELRERLERIVAVRDSPDGMMPSLKLPSLQFFPLPAPGVGSVSDSEAQIGVMGTQRDCLWLQTLTLLPAAGIGRLKRCECGRVFAKTGRREYCSPRCQRRVYMRARRADERTQATKGRRAATRKK